MFYQKRHKYHAKSVRYGGRQFRSKKEAGYARELDLLKKAGEILSWEYEPRKLDLCVNRMKICGYIPDFWVVMADGSKEIHEVKGGTFMANLGDFKIKRKLFEATWLAENPDYTYRVIM